MSSKSVSIQRATSSLAGAIRWALTVRWLLSVKILVGVGVLFLLQAFPYTGVFLMLVAAPLWSVPLVNLAVLVAGFEGLTGRAPRWFILLPVCWFGFYGLAVLRDEAALVRAKEVVATANDAAQPVVYNPDRHDIVANADVDGLLLGARLPVVYTKPRSGRDRAMRSSRLAIGSLCATLAGRKTGDKVRVRRIHRSTAGRYGLDQDVPTCIVSFQESPSREVIQLHKKTSVDTIDGLAVHSTRISAAAEGRTSLVRRAWAAILQPYPMPVVGCFLNSGAPSWDCMARFMRRKREHFGLKGQELHAFARVLDLSRAVAVPLNEASNTVVRMRLAEADARWNHRRDALLLAFLENPGGFSSHYRLLRQFKSDPSRLSPFSGRLITALEEIDAQERRGNKTARKTVGAIAQLIAQLPAVEIRQKSGRILGLLDGPARGWRRSAGPLIRRTHVLGNAALPLLTRRLDRVTGRRRLSWPQADAIIALCQMGLPAATVVGPRLLQVWHARNREQTKTVRAKNGERRDVIVMPSLGRLDRHLYVAILRLGLREEAGAAKAKHSAKWWDNAWQTVTPQSPGHVCENVR